METLVREAAEKGAKVVCFPELNISGYSLQPKRSPLAEKIPGPSTEALLQMARENHMLILAGLVEAREDEGVCISQLAAGPEGLLGIYRKLHLGPAEEGIYQAGDECSAFEYEGTIFGIELCFDAHFPELSTILALKGAEVIFIPHASPRESSEEKRARWLRYLAARAYDNSVYIVACNQVGEYEMGLSFPGAALILTPRGEVMAANQSVGEEMIYGDLTKADLRGVRESPRGFFLSKRRPAIYKELGL